MSTLAVDLLYIRLLNHSLFFLLGWMFMVSVKLEYLEMEIVRCDFIAIVYKAWALFYYRFSFCW
jgi:hypothetical protein